MTISRLIPIALVSLLILLGPASILTYAQDEEAELLPPNYVNSDHGFGIALPEGYVAFGYDTDGVWVLEIIGEYDQATAQVSAEELPEDIVDVAGFWQLMKERDPLMVRNITYEMVTSIAEVGAVLARVEGIEEGDYILAITWVFVHDGFGFTLSGYPPPSDEYNLARDLAWDLAQQFRWMTEEEIAEFEEGEIELPSGEEF